MSRAEQPAELPPQTRLEERLTDSAEGRDDHQVIALKATGALLELVTQYPNITLDNVPIQERIARKIGINSWDMIGASKEVDILLEAAKSVVAEAIKTEQAQATQHRLDLPQPIETAEFSEQMH